MKYFDLNTVVKAYEGCQGTMTNRSWGYLALLKSCGCMVEPSRPFKVAMENASYFLDDVFCLEKSNKSYRASVKYAVFSSKWDKYFIKQKPKKKDSLVSKPNIYNVIAWAFRKKRFNDDIKQIDLIRLFANEFNISVDIINTNFNTTQIDIGFSNILYTESQLILSLNKIGVDCQTGHIDGEKNGMVAFPGEASRGPFIQPMYAAAGIADYVLLLSSSFNELYDTTALKLHELKEITEADKQIGNISLLKDDYNKIKGALDILQSDFPKMLLNKLQTMNPFAFEHLLGDLFQKMKGVPRDLVVVTKSSGDGGVDGYVWKDDTKLEKDFCYQAKRYSDTNKVSSPEMQKFFGAVAHNDCKKGIFVTTGSYTNDALQYTADGYNVTKINGEQLVKLLIKYNLGVTKADAYSIDDDYFDKLDSRMS